MVPTSPRRDWSDRVILAGYDAGAVACGQHGARFSIGGEVRLSGGFQVDLGALREAAAGIHGTLEQLRTTQVAALSRTEADYGHDGLAAAVAGFCDRWQVGVQNLVKNANEVAGRLSPASCRLPMVRVREWGDGRRARRDGRSEGTRSRKRRSRDSDAGGVASLRRCVAPGEHRSAASGHRPVSAGRSAGQWWPPPVSERRWVSRWTSPARA